MGRSQYLLWGVPIILITVIESFVESLSKLLQYFSFKNLGFVECLIFTGSTHHASTSTIPGADYAATTRTEGKHHGAQGTDLT